MLFSFCCWPNDFFGDLLQFLCFVNVLQYNVFSSDLCYSHAQPTLEFTFLCLD